MQLAHIRLEVHVPNYPWICHSCKALNRPGQQVCTICGFKAVATGAEIEEVITGIAHKPVPSRKELLKERRAEIAALPFWKKPIAYLLRGVQFIGSLFFVWGIFDLSGTQILMGLGMASVAEFFFRMLKGRFSEN